MTALAGYLVILRGNTFTVGDRITMGGVRGDVISRSFMQTKIMEMGQPPAVQGVEPAMWVRSRQFTGRIVSVTNDKVFDEPVYNYTPSFPSSGSTHAIDAGSEPVQRALERAGITIASTTYEIVGVPPLRVEASEVRVAPGKP